MYDTNGNYTNINPQDQEAANMAIQGLGKLSGGTTDWIKKNWALVGLAGLGVAMISWKVYGIKKTYDRGKRTR